MKQITKEVKEKKDSINCFARLTENECNALAKKNCENCSFYKHFLEVKDYNKFLPKNFKRKIES